MNAPRIADWRHLEPRTLGLGEAGRRKRLASWEGRPEARIGRIPPTLLPGCGTAKRERFYNRFWLAKIEFWDATGGGFVQIDALANKSDFGRLCSISTIRSLGLREKPEGDHVRAGGNRHVLLTVERVCHRR